MRAHGWMTLAVVTVGLLVGCSKEEPKPGAQLKSDANKMANDAKATANQAADQASKTANQTVANHK